MRLRTALLLISALLVQSCATARPTRAERPPAGIETDGYYLSTCAGCVGYLGAKGEAIGGVWDGRELRFCSPPCLERFTADVPAGIAGIDAVMIADQLPHYPLATSVVSGRALGSRPVDVVWGNRLFRLASEAEREELLADPSRFLRLLNRAVIEAQEPTYGMPDKCPVQGDILASDSPRDLVVANRMVRVCCGRCARAVRARPYQYLGMVEFANQEAARREGREGQHPPPAHR